MTLPRTCLILGLATAGAAIVIGPALKAQTVIPTDAQQACPLSSSTFANMFVGKQVTLNGAVNPADSTINPGANPNPGQPDPTVNCRFFLWTEQMFLWLTSPLSPQGPAGGPVTFTSSPFYTVVTPESGAAQFLVPNQPGQAFRMKLRINKPGPGHLPTLRARSGHLIEVERVVRSPRRPIVRLASGGVAALHDVERGPGGKLRFLGAGRKPLKVAIRTAPSVQQATVTTSDNRRLAVLSPGAGQNSIRAQKLMFGKVPVYLDASNVPIDVEPEQADGSVLLTQNNALVFYMTFVNQMYAYHRTMQGPTVAAATVFPTAADIKKVASFAQTYNQPPLANPNTLAMEIKSSWVEASSVSNPDDYIQVVATIPTFNRTNSQTWVQTGEKTAKMVMIGMHVVGNTTGHGEMVWGTMEHVGNTPNAAYNYINQAGGLATVGQPTGGTWLFPTSASTSAPKASAQWPSPATVPPSITATTSAGIVPVANLRVNPWGIPGLVGMPGSNVTTNTQLVSVNRAVMAQLLQGDVRANYFQVGTLWTNGGAPPDATNPLGSITLANTTMETFVQGNSCFACHQSTSKTVSDVTISHVYPSLTPLFPLTKSRR